MSHAGKNTDDTKARIEWLSKRALDEIYRDKKEVVRMMKDMVRRLQDTVAQLEVEENRLPQSSYFAGWSTPHQIDEVCARLTCQNRHLISLGWALGEDAEEKTAEKTTGTK